MKSDCNLTDSYFDCRDCSSYEKEIKKLKTKLEQAQEVIEQLKHYNGDWTAANKWLSANPKDEVYDRIKQTIPETSQNPIRIGTLVSEQ